MRPSLYTLYEGFFLFSSVRPNMVQSPECASHIQQAYADTGPINIFNMPRGTCVDESDINATSWIPRCVWAETQASIL